MSKKKRTSNKRVDIKIRNVSDISGNMNIAGGDITTHTTNTGLSAADIGSYSKDSILPSKQMRKLP